LSKINIDISDHQKFLSIDRPQLCKTVKHVLRHLAVKDAAVSLAVVDNQTIRRLHAGFLDNPEVTDVLSFDLHDDHHNSSAELNLDCEVIVNAQRALEVAQDRRSVPLAELNLYVVHGLLHQLGFDDQLPEQAEKMHQKEDQLLAELGFGKVYSQNMQQR
jgi:probable rRNA maturation factor